MLYRTAQMKGDADMMTKCALAVLASGLLCACDLPQEPETGAALAADTSTGFTINPATGWPDSGSTWTKGTSTVTGTGAWNVALSLPVGSHVPSIATTVIDSSTSDVVMTLVSYVGSSFTVVSQAGSASTGAQTLSMAPIHTVTATESLVLRFTTPGSTSAPTVGSIGVGAAPALTPTLTLQVPISLPGAGIPANVQFVSGRYTAPFGLPIGSTVSRIRIMATDVAGQPPFVVGLRESDAIGNSFVNGAGSPSIGNGTFQTVSSSPMIERIVSGVNYGCEAIMVTGAAPCTIHSCEVDYTP